MSEASPDSAPAQEAVAPPPCTNEFVAPGCEMFMDGSDKVIAYREALEDLFRQGGTPGSPEWVAAEAAENVLLASLATPPAQEAATTQRHFWLNKFGHGDLYDGAWLDVEGGAHVSLSIDRDMLMSTGPYLRLGRNCAAFLMVREPLDLYTGAQVSALRAERDAAVAAAKQQPATITDEWLRKVLRIARVWPDDDAPHAMLGPARRYAEAMQEAGFPIAPEPAQPQAAGVEAEYQRIGLLEWAVTRWREDVQNRPLVNVYRPGMDKAWRQVIRHAGGDPEALIGPAGKLPATAPTLPTVPDLAPKQAAASPEIDALAEAVHRALDAWAASLIAEPEPDTFKAERLALYTTIDRLAAAARQAPTGADAKGGA